MHSNHFNVSLLATYIDLLDAACVSPESFLRETQRKAFNHAEPADSAENFAQSCDIICEMLLPRSTALASINVSPDLLNSRAVNIRTSSASSYGGRDFAATLATEAATALRLFDSCVATAIRLGLEVNLR